MNTKKRLSTTTAYLRWIASLITSLMVVQLLMRGDWLIVALSIALSIIMISIVAVFD